MRLLPFTPTASRCATSDLGMRPGSRSRSRSACSPGCLTLAPGELRPRDSASGVAGYRSRYAAYRRGFRFRGGHQTASIAHAGRGHRTTGMSSTCQRTDGRDCAARGPHPDRLSNAPTGPAARLEQGHGRDLSGMVAIPCSADLRSRGARPARAPGSCSVLLRACLGVPGRRPGARPRWFGSEWTELVAHAKRYADTCGWPATLSSARSGFRQLVRKRSAKPYPWCRRAPPSGRLQGAGD
jgi:hypothetical protein